MRVALLGRLPSGDGNGLSAVAAEMAKEPSRLRVAVVLLDADRIVEKTDDGNHEVRARVRRVEVIHDAEDAGTLQRLLAREFERRTGQTVLPLDLESDVKAAFADLDPAGFAQARDERERTEVEVEHTGADDGWAATLRAMREGEGSGTCSCGAVVVWDGMSGAWLDPQGLPADDGHRHEPAPQDGEAG